MDDYSNFSWEAIQKSLKDSVDEVQRKTGATDEQMNRALSEVAKKFININFLKEPKDFGTFFWVCQFCGTEHEFAISKLTHSPFGSSDCLACNVKPGQRVPFHPMNGKCGPACRGKQ